MHLSIQVTSIPRKEDFVYDKLIPKVFYKGDHVCVGGYLSQLSIPQYVSAKKYRF